MTTQLTENEFSPLPPEWDELDTNDRARWIEANTSFHYIYDGRDWSSGIWYSGVIGSLNNGGGSYPRMSDAVAGFERFHAAFAAA